MSLSDDENAGFASGSDEALTSASSASPEAPPSSPDDAETGTEVETETPASSPADTAPAKNEEPDWESRLRELEQQISETRRAIPAPPAPKDEVWETFRTDYPDIANPVGELLKRQQQQFQEALGETRARMFEEAMDVARPDWRELRQDEAFLKWIQSNPKQQQAAQQPGVRPALGVLKAYDEDRKAQAIHAQRQSRLKAAESTPIKGSRAPSLSDALDGWAAD